jgi:hypothetical protein
MHMSDADNVENREVQVHFEQQGSELTAVQIERRGRSPVIMALHRALLPLGIVVQQYQARPGPLGLLERVALQRRDGGPIQGSLDAAARAAILPIAFREGGFVAAS